MELLSINVSLPKEVPFHGGTVSTGIFKEPVRGLWHLTFCEPQNLEGAKKALRLPSLAPEWRKPMEKRLIRAGIPLE